MTSLSLVHVDGRAALDDVSLRVPSGQFCVVLGPSGAGKSSLLGVIGGSLAPTAGAVWLDDAPAGLVAHGRARPAIGQIHQSLALVRQSSAAENIMAGAAGRMAVWRAATGLYPAWAKERAVRLHLALGLDGNDISRSVSALSGGQQQRVAIARALMGEPDVLLADEPVSSLDSVTSRQVLDVIRERQRTCGMTVVCALHQPELAREYADRVVVMEAGRIVFDGAPGDYPVRAVRQAAA